MPINHQTKTQRKQKRVRSKIHGTALIPRLSVNRSNKYIYLQAIDDDKSTTIASVSSQSVDAKTNKTEAARLAGVAMAQKLHALKIEKAVFDRGSYIYKGRVKAICEGVRSAEIII